MTELFEFDVACESHLFIGPANESALPLVLCVFKPQRHLCSTHDVVSLRKRIEGYV